MLKSLPVELVIVLPTPAVKVPRIEARDTPVVALVALLMVTKGRLAVTVFRSAAAPPVASMVATPAPTAIWKPAEPV